MKKDFVPNGDYLRHYDSRKRMGIPKNSIRVIQSTNLEMICYIKFWRQYVFFLRVDFQRSCQRRRGWTGEGNWSIWIHPGKQKQFQMLSKEEEQGWYHHWDAECSRREEEEGGGGGAGGGDEKKTRENVQSNRFGRKWLQFLFESDWGRQFFCDKKLIIALPSVSCGVAHSSYCASYFAKATQLNEYTISGKVNKFFITVLGYFLL